MLGLNEDAVPGVMKALEVYAVVLVLRRESGAGTLVLLVLYCIMISIDE